MDFGARILHHAAAEEPGLTSHDRLAILLRAFALLPSVQLVQLLGQSGAPSPPGGRKRGRGNEDGQDGDRGSPEGDVPRITGTSGPTSTDFNAGIKYRRLEVDPALTETEVPTISAPGEARHSELPVSASLESICRIAALRVILTQHSSLHAAVSRVHPLSRSLLYVFLFTSVF